MAATLEVAQHHHSAEVADMQAVCRRVNAYVCRGHFFGQLFFRAGHHLVNHASPFEFFYEIHVMLFLLNSLRLQSYTLLFQNLLFCVVIFGT